MGYLARIQEKSQTTWDKIIVLNLTSHFLLKQKNGIPKVLQENVFTN